MSNKFKNIKTKEGYEMINLPIFRAKRIDSNEYVIGYLLQDCFGFYIIQTDNALRCESLNNESIEINPATLAIHFPDMIDSQGNKIFASLQEYGKGGDVFKDEDGHKVVVKYQNKQITYRYYFNEKLGAYLDVHKNYKLKVIGIKE